MNIDVRLLISFLIILTVEGTKPLSIGLGVPSLISDSVTQVAPLSVTVISAGLLNLSFIECGEYGTVITLNTTSISITYTFVGKTTESPTSCSRRQVITTSAEELDDECKSNMFLCLEYGSEYLIINWEGETATVRVNRVVVRFRSKEELLRSLCTDSTELNKDMSITDVDCSGDVISALRNRIHTEEKIPYLFAEDTVTVSELDRTMVYSIINRNICVDDIASVIGIILTFILLIAFIFLMVFAYSNKKKADYTGNGINVQNIQHISKPFSSGVNPYTKKTDESLEMSNDEKKVTTVEIPTISIVHHGTRSSFILT